MGRTSINESDILERVMAARNGPLPAAAARSLLALKFPATDARRIRGLLRKNNAGTITANERIALEKYLRVGQFLDLLHARAGAALGKPPRPE
jgi:hypothetical protein